MTGTTGGDIVGDDAVLADALATLFPGFEGVREPPGWLLDLIGRGLGGVLLFGRNIDTADPVGGCARLTTALRSARADLLVAVDEEGGQVTRLEHDRGSSHPGSAALGVVDDVAVTAAVTTQLATTLRAGGIDLDLAPVADVDADPRNPVIGLRSFGSDPALVARHVGAAVTALQDAGVAATVKHFPGHGATREDSHLTTPQVDADRALLDARELVPFRAAIRAGAAVVMTAHLRVPALSPTTPAVPATLNREILTDVLRGELGFDGVVMTDGLDMHAISRTVGVPEGAVQALAAGADAICVGGDSTTAAQVHAVVDAVLAAVAQGRLPRARLAEAADRVRRLGGWALSARRSGPVVAGVRPGQAGGGQARAGGTGTGAGHSGASGTGVGLDAGREVAARVLRPRGRVRLNGSPLVIELHARVDVAAGAVPWSVAGPLLRHWPSTDVVRITDADADRAVDLAEAAVAEFAGGAGGAGDTATRPVVLAVQALLRLPWQRDVVQAVLARRPDAVVVDQGNPDPDPPGAHGLLTYGSARVAVEAAADLLIGEDGRSA